MAATGARIVNFRTDKMSTSKDNALKHVLKWESSTGNLSDLSHIRTREIVEWDAPPAEFGGTGPYSAAGRHEGFGFSQANRGTNTDSHDIIPTKGNIRYREPPNGKSSGWTMRQRYQYSVNGGAFEDIPHSNYQITRWFKKCSKTLDAYVEKRGLHDGKKHESKKSVKKYFS